MSERAVWKLMHLLNLYGKPSISEDKLNKAGAGFDPRTYLRLEHSGIIKKDLQGEIELSSGAQEILMECVVANQSTYGLNLRVDYPQVFVAMTFGENWSDRNGTKIS